MKVLIVGSGAREHALALMMARSSSEPRIYVASDYANPGLSRVAEESGGKLMIARSSDPEAVARVAEAVSPDLVVIGPEEPQFAGVADELRRRGFTVFGAGRRCAEIERSKVFARELMWRHSIPGRLYFAAFRSVEEAREFSRFAGEVVIKPARQAGGKGVRVLSGYRAYLHEDYEEMARRSIESVASGVMKSYSDTKYTVLVEQLVEGVEYTATLITDGSYHLPLPLAQDHPHAFDFDIGPETGGMGSISGPGWLLPFIERGEFERSVEIVRRAVEALQSEVGERYVGAIAGQMMLTGLWGPTVIEFYSRFGDPEIANLLPVVESDMLEILDAAASGRLASKKLEIDETRAVVVKAVAPAGYPLRKSLGKGHPIAVDEARARELGCVVLYGSVEMRGSEMVTRGSRAIEIVCTASSHEEAARLANRVAAECVRSLDGWPLFFRSDIGTSRLLSKRVELAQRVRRVYRSKEAAGTLGEFYVWVPGKGFFSNPILARGR
ncbi:MAG: phosphoribosylamine--glycine ligase [Crenarchaeota archaeon]|nr:phosphoribosylamine--glycine ligase [Thermoproteota archaeon]